MRIVIKTDKETIEKLRRYLKGIKGKKTDKISFMSNNLSIIIKKEDNNYTLTVDIGKMWVSDSITGFTKIDIEIDINNNEIIFYATNIALFKPINVQIWITDYMYIGYKIELE